MQKHVFAIKFSVIMWVCGWVVGGWVGGTTQTSDSLNLHAAAGWTSLGLQILDKHPVKNYRIYR